MCEGIARELEGINLGDERLDRRSKLLLEALAAHPQASINGACEGWADTQAAYRFFNNGAVTPEKILAPHRAATVDRMRQQPVALIVQDTTELDYTQHPPRDAQCLNRPERRGLYDHTHLALTPDQLCLGVVGCEQFARTPESLGQADQRSALPIEAKESLRWLTGYRLACQLAAECPDTQIVSIADREADIYDIFVEAQQHAGPRAEYIIRARVERCLTERDPAAGAAAYCKVRDEVRAAPLLGKRTIELAQTPQRAAREATLEVRALTVTIKPPHARSHLPAVTLQVVLAEEVGGPDDGTAVSWLLLTSLPAATLAAALLVLDYYVARWLIEVYFRVFKTGCCVEEIQLETTARLQNCLAFYKIIAARVLYLTHLNRTAGQMSCAAVFAAEEWKSVWRVVKQQPLPKQPPQLSEFMQLLTQLGGYNNRASEDPPGPQPLWIGIRRMLDFARAWLAFGPESGAAKCV
jgi:hypothetical protein